MSVFICWHYNFFFTSKGKLWSSVVLFLHQSLLTTGYIQVQAFDASKGCESCVHSFIIQRPKVEPGFYVQGTEAAGRFQRYTIQSYAVQAKPAIDTN